MRASDKHRTSGSSEHRGDITALRALAVAAVVLYHFLPKYFPSGFAGVDIFLVISGFLITKILTENVARESKKFSLLSFYGRRFARIAPALAVMIMSSLVAFWNILTPGDLEAASKEALSAIIFLSNFKFYWETSYFAASVYDQPFLHTWSLSLEWQFYFTYPLLMIPIINLQSRKLAIFAVTLIAAASLTLCIFAFARNTAFSFYMLPARYWEFMIGSIAYFGVFTNERVRPLILVTSFIGLVAGFVFVHEGTPWPGAWTVLICVSVAGILACDCRHSMLSSPFVQWLGTRSYSIYLYHWPILVVLTYLGMSGEATGVIIALIATAVLAEISYRLVENPRWISRLALGAVTAPVAGVAMSALILQDGYFFQSQVLRDQQSFISRYKKMHGTAGPSYLQQCNFHDQLVRTNVASIEMSCTDAAGGGAQSLLLWGDSHAQALSHGIRAGLSKEFTFWQITSSGCAPGLSGDPRNKNQGLQKEACIASNQFATKVISERRPSVVVLAAQGDHDRIELQRTVSWLRSAGVEKVLVIGPMPQWRPSLPRVVAFRHWNSGATHIRDPGLDFSLFISNERARQQVEGIRGVVFIDLLANLCPGGACRWLVEGELLVFDYGHLTNRGSRFVALEYILPHVFTSAEP